MQHGRTTDQNVQNQSFVLAWASSLMFIFIHISSACVILCLGVSISVPVQSFVQKVVAKMTCYVWSEM